MSLYQSVSDRAVLLRAVSDRVYGGVQPKPEEPDDAIAALRALLTRYHDRVVAHPRLTLAIFAEPDAFADASHALTDRLERLLATRTPACPPWPDILVDQAYGTGLAIIEACGDAAHVKTFRHACWLALDSLLAINGGNDPNE